MQLKNYGKETTEQLLGLSGPLKRTKTSVKKSFEMDPRSMATEVAKVCGMGPKSLEQLDKSPYIVDKHLNF